MEILSPFQQFTPGAIIQNGRWDIPLVMVSLVITVVAILASYWLYSRRDISSAV